MTKSAGRNVDTSAAKVAELLGITRKSLAPPKIRPLTLAKKAKILKVKLAEIANPITLTPLEPNSDGRILVFDSCISTSPFGPGGSGRADFNSLYQGKIEIPSYKKAVVYKYKPGVRVYFPTLKETGNSKYLIEYHVALWSFKASYSLLRAPSGQTTILTGPTGFGPKSAVVTELIEDASEGTASLLQDNAETDYAHWILYSVIITAV